MASSISLNKSKSSKLKRLPFLPRFGFTIDFAGVEFSYRKASILETLYNLKDRGLSLKSLIDVSMEQLREIKIQPELSEEKPQESLSLNA